MCRTSESTHDRSREQPTDAFEFQFSARDRDSDGDGDVRGAPLLIIGVTRVITRNKNSQRGRGVALFDAQPRPTNLAV